MRSAWLAALMALSLGLNQGAGAGGAQPSPTGWDLALSAGAPVAITAEPVKISGGKLTGLTLSGAWVLRGDHPDFGGFSGLVVSQGRLFAVSDLAWWLGASLREEGGALHLTNARLAPMRDGEGDGYSKSGGDAEGLTRLGDRLAVSFERDHRVMLLRETGRLGSTIRHRGFERLRSNQSLEALATLPDGRIIVLGEGPDRDGFPVFLIDQAGQVTEARLPRTGQHLVTGADIGPDGRLYLVLREYSLLFGVSIQVMRYRLGPDGLPLPGSAETLAVFEAASGIDNMEGIALDRGPGGDIRLWLISDDNFQLTQRTLLVRFDVLK